MKSIIQTDGTYCFRCKNAIGTEDHHMLPGNPGRKYSEQDGLKVRICRECHEYLHSSAGSKQLLAYKKLGQEKWEAYYGPRLIEEGKDPRDEFRKRYGRNYL